MTPAIKNITCENSACTKPLLTIHLTARGPSVESYGTSVRVGPMMLGNLREYWAVCEHCAHETKLSADEAELVLGG